jgi:hypothetical protein
MNKTCISSTVLILAALAVSACNVPGPIAKESSAETGSPPAAATQTQPPSATATLTLTATATPEPSLTPTPAPLPLEIVEWNVYPYANLVDPQNTDKRVEILVRNPNGFPVRVNMDQVELRLLNAAGEIVYTNPNPTFYIWEGSWILGGETAAMSACACFDTDGLEKQAWESLELVAPLEEAAGIAYTHDVDVSLGEFFSLQEAHLGGDQLGANITLTNTSGQVLKSFEVRVIALDASGKYVGVAISGSFADRDNSGNYLDIEPGASASGIVVTEIDYVDEPLTYEVTAIGIPVDK